MITVVPGYVPGYTLTTLIILQGWHDLTLNVVLRTQNPWQPRPSKDTDLSFNPIHAREGGGHFVPFTKIIAYLQNGLKFGVTAL